MKVWEKKKKYTQTLLQADQKDSKGTPPNLLKIKNLMEEIVD